MIGVDRAGCARGGWAVPGGAQQSVLAAMLGARPEIYAVEVNSVDVHLSEDLPLAIIAPMNTVVLDRTAKPIAVEGTVTQLRRGRCDNGQSVLVARYPLRRNDSGSGGGCGEGVSSAGGRLRGPGWLNRFLDSACEYSIGD
ncbi:hypothetical protein AB0L63_21295 [Nocardia sp. NPDC051990]|uniref:hypothetical protein n=1 Tax=Nocardia sp. NPDC051990 TaxID=3155285 RepID=UPI00341CF7D8